MIGVCFRLMRTYPSVVASAVAAPGTIDGGIYMRPEISLYAHLMVQPEIVLQGLVLGAWVARWMAPVPQNVPQRPATE